MRGQLTPPSSPHVAAKRELDSTLSNDLENSPERSEVAIFFCRIGCKISRGIRRILNKIVRNH